MPIRVLEIIPTFDRGGAEKQLTLLAAGLPRVRFEVHVAALTRGGPLAADLAAADVPATVIGKSWKVDPVAYWRLRRHIAQLRPAIVHTWLFAANAYGRQAALAARTPHIVGGERCVDPWKSWRELAIDRYLARRSDAIVTNSSGVRDFYAARGVAADKFVVIPNGVPEVGEPTTARAELLAELRLPAAARLIGAVGRLWPQKRVRDLIWAAELLKVVRDDTHLLIVGDGPQFESLRRFRDDLELADRVHFLGHRDDVPRLLPHFDCLWLASGYEGQSNAVLEAMAWGVPVVATDIAGNRDLVAPEQTGALVPVGDAAGFARRTLELLEDASLAQRWGAAARRRVREEFSVAAMIDRHAALYERLAAS